MIKKYIFIFFLLSLNVVVSQTTIKTMFYNLLNYPTAPPQNRDVILKNILNGYAPDIFMVCELENQAAADNILSFSLSEIPKNYEKTTFVTNQSSSGTGSNLQQLVYYNTAYFILDSQEEITTNIRDINHYTFIIKTSDYLVNPISLEIYVSHLKASQGIDNENLRLQMINAFTANLANLPANSFVIFAGDFNFYTSTESGYQKILNANNAVVMKDPLNTNNSLQSWHNNFNWKNIHTQATRISSSGFSGYGAGGGLDDRFDFIMLSENILNDSEINYVNNSYKSYGNNGNCFNNSINNANCSGGFSQSLRTNLYNMSDHLPVVLSLQTNQTLSLNDNLINPNIVSLKGGNIITDKIQLSVNPKLIGQELSIYNTIGQKLYSKKINSNTIDIDGSLFSKGFYYIKIENYFSSIKLIKL